MFALTGMPISLVLDVMLPKYVAQVFYEKFGYV
jgi:hypothetical protein